MQILEESWWEGKHEKQSNRQDFQTLGTQSWCFWSYPPIKTVSISNTITYSTLGLKPSAFLLTHFIFVTTLWSRSCYLHSAQELLEQRHRARFLRSQSLSNGRPTNRTQAVRGSGTPVLSYLLWSKSGKIDICYVKLHLEKVPTYLEASGGGRGCKSPWQ